jgi:hypothetical protein
MKISIRLCTYKEIEEKPTEEGKEKYGDDSPAETKKKLGKCLVGMKY